MMIVISRIAKYPRDCVEPAGVWDQFGKEEIRRVRPFRNVRTINILAAVVVVVVVVVVEAGGGGAAAGATGGGAKPGGR